MLNRYYAVLGLPTSASKSDVKKRYRLLAKKYHPDVSAIPNARERFIEITKAYETIMDRFERPARYVGFSTPSTKKNHRQYKKYRYKRQGTAEERAKRYSKMRYSKFKSEEKWEHPYPVLKWTMISFATGIYLLPYITFGYFTNSILAGILSFVFFTGIFYLTTLRFSFMNLFK